MVVLVMLVVLAFLSSAFFALASFNLVVQALAFSAFDWGLLLPPPLPASDIASVGRKSKVASRGS